MSIDSRLIKQLIAGLLVILLTSTLAEAAPAPLPQTLASESSLDTPEGQVKTQGSTAESIGQGANSAPNGNLQPSATDSHTDPSQGTNQDPQSAPSQPVADQQQPGMAQPVGTAAAPLEKSAGVAASKPAGAVIAPAKQRRAHSFIIKLGVVVGACVAIGTVAALSHSSPSQPH